MLHNNTTGGFKPMPCGKRDGETIRRSVDVSLGIIVVILNIIEIILIARLKRKKRIYEVLLLSLSCADLLFGFANILVSVIYLSNSCRFEDVLEGIYSFYLFVILTSILHLSWIALDRLWAITKPFHHNVHVTRKRIFILVVCTWVLTISITVSLHLTEELTEAFGRKGDDNVTTVADNAQQITTTPPLIITTPDNLNITNGNAGPLPSLNERPPRVRIRTRRPLITGTRPNNITRRPLIIGTRPNNTRVPRKKRPPPPPLRPKSKEKYREMVQLTISVFIIIADVVFITSYGLMIYILDQKTKFNKLQAKKEDRISLVCIFIAATFVLFTLPYALARFISGTVPFEANVVLIINSGLNCIVYFFRNKCEKYIEKKYKSEASTASDTSNTNFTPVPTPTGTPVQKRAMLSDGKSTTPNGTPALRRAMLNSTDSGSKNSIELPQTMYHHKVDT